MYCTISILDDQNSISPDQISLLNLTYAQSKNLTFLFKNLLPAYLCTDISVNFTQESPVLQLPVEENRNSLSSTQPILWPSMSQKVVFAAKRLCTMVGTEFRVLRAVTSKKFQKYVMKNKSTLLKIRKNVKFLFLWNHWRKKIHAKTFYFLKNTRNHW